MTAPRLLAATLALGLAHTTPAMAQAIGDPGCDRLLLVSSYQTDSVKVYDACSGDHLQDLADEDLLRGPQAIQLDGNGDIVVVSEGNSRLLRFDRQSLTLSDVVSGNDPRTPEPEPTPVLSPTAFTITPGGRWFMGSFSQNTVIEIDPATGGSLGTVIGPTAGLAGPDAGSLAAGGWLYVPGFDSSNVVRVGIGGNDTVETFIGRASGGLNAARMIVRDANGDYLVTSWRGGQVLAYGPGGGFKRVVTDEVVRPTGVAFESPEVLLVTSDASSDVRRIRLADGALLGTLVPAGGGGLAGGTYLLLIDKEQVETAMNRAFWVVGLGRIEERSIVVDELFQTRGGVFGPGYDPAQVTSETWGSLVIDFTGCDAGDLGYDAVAPGFGAGGYALARLAPSPAGRICSEAGFDLVTDPAWMSGHWFGGPARDGEGFSIDVIDGGMAIVTWYTYRLDQDDQGQ